jgi:dinuclear metal center YbgI/SA1388 family protein
MQIGDIIQYLESLAPLSSQESYDNSGLIVGNRKTTVTKTLISLDCTEEIVEEAKAKGCNLIIAHHPIVFKGLKQLNGKNYVERTVIAAIKNDIAIYAIHTNLDNYKLGVNKKIADLLGIENPKILAPVSQKLFKLVVFCPESHANAVEDALFEAGAGEIGNYSECSFSTFGAGSFKANEGANPHVGEKGKRHYEGEAKIEVISSIHLMGKVVNAMKAAHPYEEVAYDCIPLLNKNQDEGAGMIGQLSKPVEEKTFLTKLKKTFGCEVIRHTSLREKPIKTVAWCGGSGSFLLPKAKAQKADIYITGDFKYHEFFDAENEIVIADIGHFESEQYTIELLSELLTKKFATFAACLTERNTNPVKYF